MTRLRKKFSVNTCSCARRASRTTNRYLIRNHYLSTRAAARDAQAAQAEKERKKRENSLEKKSEGARKPASKANGKKSLDLYLKTQHETLAHEVLSLAGSPSREAPAPVSLPAQNPKSEIARCMHACMLSYMHSCKKKP